MPKKKGGKKLQKAKSVKKVKPLTVSKFSW